MRRIILTVLGSALLASTVQVAAAAEHNKDRRIDRAPAPATGGFRNSNAYWPAPSAEPDSSRYQNGAESAPAGH
jgi:Spy/CpxP family protein refolding chaperone